MAYITGKMSEGDYAVALDNFKTVCAANALALGLTVPDVTEISNASADFLTALNAAATARAAATSATTAKDDQYAETRDVVSKWAKKFRANPAISDALLSSLMLPMHTVPAVKTPPTTPSSLVGSADGDGQIELRWNRNGNRQGTVFAIEYRLSPTEAWEPLDSTTRARYSYEAAVGQYISFRIRAKRSGQTSAASTPFSFWDSSESAELKLAA